MQSILLLMHYGTVLHLVLYCVRYGVVCGTVPFLVFWQIKFDKFDKFLKSLTSLILTNLRSVY